MIKVRDISEYLESVAPAAHQESYDNIGLLVGNPENVVTGVLTTLDCTEEVVKEAIEKGFNMIVAHHPLIFKGLKRLTGSTYVERTALMAIRNDISIYALHTNLDNIYRGVNYKIGEKLGLRNMRIMAPRKNVLSKLTVFVPVEDTAKVLEALYAAGAGNIGNYQNCSFRTAGTGTFMPNEQANPHIGERNKQEETDENRIEVIFPAHLERRILEAMKEAHPYEEAAYYLHLLENSDLETGSGMIGELPSPLNAPDFLQKVKEVFKLEVVRYTESRGENVERVAVCGGSGSFLLSEAIRQRADALITADFKYHEFFDSEGKIIIADIGHYESEYYTKELIHEILNKKFTNIAAEISAINTNPVRYLL